MLGNDGCTKLLIHSNTTNGDTSFTDNSYIESTITRTGDTQHLTNQFKMGTTSMYFDGAGDYLSIPSNAEFGIDVGEDFTIEMWYYANSPDDETELFNMATAYDTDISNCQLKILKDQAPSTKWIFDMNGGGAGRILFDGDFTAKWNHLAIVRYNGDIEYGPYIALGFRPECIMLKGANISDYWHLWSDALSPDNVMDDNLIIDEAFGKNTAENRQIDFLSQGFKIRTDLTGANTNGQLYIGFAWAKQFGPFSNAK
jgi:hypothetical protein